MLRLNVTSLWLVTLEKPSPVVALLWLQNRESGWRQTSNIGKRQHGIVGDGKKWNDWNTQEVLEVDSKGEGVSEVTPWLLACGRSMTFLKY